MAKDNLARDTPLVVYLSGPISGYKGCNRKCFAAADKLLTHLGFEVINPLDETDSLPEDGKTSDQSWLGHVIRGLRNVAQADAIYFLPNSERSVGSQLERAVAIRLKKLVLEHFDWSYAGDPDDEEG